MWCLSSGLIPCRTVKLTISLRGPSASAGGGLPALQEVVVDQCQFAAIALSNPGPGPPAPGRSQDHQLTESLSNESKFLYCMPCPVLHDALLFNQIVLNMRRYSESMPCRTKMCSLHFLGLTWCLSSDRLLWKATWYAEKTFTPDGESGVTDERRRASRPLHNNNSHTAARMQAFF